MGVHTAARPVTGLGRGVQGLGWRGELQVSPQCRPGLGPQSEVAILAVRVCSCGFRGPHGHVCGAGDRTWARGLQAHSL